MPARAYVAEPADFTVTVTNTGTHPLADVIVHFFCDRALEINNVTNPRGCDHRVWKLASLPPGGSKDFQEECYRPTAGRTGVCQGERDDGRWTRRARGDFSGDSEVLQRTASTNSVGQARYKTSRQPCREPSARK